MGEVFLFKFNFSSLDGFFLAFSIRLLYFLKVVYGWMGHYSLSLSLSHSPRPESVTGVYCRSLVWCARKRENIYFEKVREPQKTKFVRYCHVCTFYVISAFARHGKNDQSSKWACENKRHFLLFCTCVITPSLAIDHNKFVALPKYFFCFYVSTWLLLLFWLFTN